MYGDSNVYHYELEMPVYVADAGESARNLGGDGVYPASCQWFIANRLIYVKKWTAAEYAAMAAEN